MKVNAGHAPERLAIRPLNEIRRGGSGLGSGVGVGAGAGACGGVGEGGTGAGEGDGTGVGDGDGAGGGAGGAVWVNETRRSFTVRVAVRLEPAFAATFRMRVPSPCPSAGVTCSQDALLLAVQTHSRFADTIVVNCVADAERDVERPDTATSHRTCDGTASSLGVVDPHPVSNTAVAHATATGGRRRASRGVRAKLGRHSVSRIGAARVQI